MKKITLLLALLMWSSNFYAQTYLTEGFETWTVGPSTLPTGWVEETGISFLDVGMYPWQSTAESSNNSGMTGNTGTQAAWFNEIFALPPFNEDPAVSKHRFLISPVMDLSATTDPELTYYEATRFHAFGVAPTLVGVYYSTNYSPGNAGTTATWTAINDVYGGADSELTWKIRGPFVLPEGAKVANVVIAFQYLATFATEWFVDDVLIREPVSCVEPSAGDVTNIQSTSVDFAWTSGPSSTATSWEVELVNLTLGENQGSGTVTTEVVTTKSFTTLPSSNNFELYVRADCDNAPGGNDSLWSGPYAFTTAPANNECSGAISVTHETNNATPTVTNGSINGATISLGEPYCGGTANNDVWYSFVATGNVGTIKVDAPGDFDVIVHLYLSTDTTCGTLVELPAPICSDSAGSGLGDEFTTPLVDGETYYIRIYDFFATIPVDGSFGLSVYSDFALSTDTVELEKNEFRFYPNPVQDKLNIRSQKTIDNISIYNMLGQEVLRSAPNSKSDEIDMSALRTGAYFVKISVDGITETKQIIKK